MLLILYSNVLQHLAHLIIPWTLFFISLLGIIVTLPYHWSTYLGHLNSSWPWDGNYCAIWQDVDWLRTTPVFRLSWPLCDVSQFEDYNSSSVPYLAFSFIHQWLYSPLLGPGFFFSYVIFFTQAARPLWRVISPSQDRYLHTGQHKHRINAKHTAIHTSSGIWTHDPSVRASEDIHF
jgi:hypothetical protein